MTIEPFSKHIFWSYKPDADLPERVVIQQVIAYGEISDIRLISKMVPHQVINEAIEKLVFHWLKNILPLMFYTVIVGSRLKYLLTAYSY
mgnify:CR=1 FL=1